MSSAGSESPRSNQHSPNPPPDEVTLEKLCKKGATVTRASELLDELTTRFSEFRRGTDLSNSTTALCAFIASEQLENKDVSVGLARTSSGLTWDQFWLLLKEVQDALVSAASSSSAFKYSRLPAYVPPCDTCESKHFECVRKIAPSTKCQVCSIRKKVCTRQENVYEKPRRFDETKGGVDDDLWLSDLDSELEKSKDTSRLVKQPRSPSPSAQLESLLNDIDESKKAQVPIKVQPSPTLSPKWTTLEDSGSTPSHPEPSRSHDTDASQPLKRKIDSTSDPNGKKRRFISPSHDYTSTKEFERTSSSTYTATHPSRSTVLQKGHPLRPNDKKHTNGTLTSSGHGPPTQRKYPRPFSPTSSEEGLTHRSSTSHKNSPPNHRSRTDESKLLREALQKKAREVITYVESEGCKGIALRLHILDMKTRLVELDRIKAEPVPSKSNVQALENMLRRAAEAVVLCLQSDGCADVDLRLMVLDLDTRLSEMDKEH
ncbi:hypothetical protein BDY19DRAFT_998089 [Irpex rosettiformis]|uniref:Uncharacterized protein n=1 Tax=Irpex rosettiformis TaxID=378272 RepID=A0ACB8TPU0_9APHY|nr:hypothetical protein BDY19DRAFT_998089 [Irpex rosettiformis]